MPSPSCASPVRLSLALPDPDQQRLDRLADVRKDKAVWEHQRK
ncbi:hypothetical protein [Streptomyces sp. NPDC102360]